MFNSGFGPPVLNPWRTPCMHICYNTVYHDVMRGCCLRWRNERITLSIIYTYTLLYSTVFMHPIEAKPTYSLLLRCVLEFGTRYSKTSCFVFRVSCISIHTRSQKLNTRYIHDNFRSAIYHCWTTKFY